MVTADRLFQIKKEDYASNSHNILDTDEVSFIYNYNSEGDSVIQIFSGCINDEPDHICTILVRDFLKVADVISRSENGGERK